LFDRRRAPPPEQAPGGSMPRPAMPRYIDVYASDHPWALPLVQDYLDQFGIDAVVRPNGMSLYPMAVGPLSGFRVSVPEGARRTALTLLAQAIRDEVIPGEVLDDDAGS